MLVSALVEQSARDAAILGQGANLSAEDMSWGVDLFNAMLFAWALDGMDMGHATQVSTDTLLVDDAYTLGIRHNLAVLMSAERGTQIDPRIAFLAERERGQIQAALCDIDELRVDEALLGPKLTFDHTTGE